MRAGSLNSPFPARGPYLVVERTEVGLELAMCAPYNTTIHPSWWICQPQPRASSYELLYKRWSARGTRGLSHGTVYKIQKYKLIPGSESCTPYIMLGPPYCVLGNWGSPWSRLQGETQHWKPPPALELVEEDGPSGLVESLAWPWLLRGAIFLWMENESKPMSSKDPCQPWLGDDAPSASFTYYYPYDSLIS